MFQLHALCALVLRRSQAALKKAAGKASNPAACSQALTAPLGTRLVQACRKNGPLGLIDQWQLLPFAFPERFAAGLSCLGGNVNGDCGLDPATRQLLNAFRTGDAEFYHLDQDVSRLRSVLLCHGLSPQGDSLLLLAELGRALRVAAYLGLPKEVMLLDPQWQLLNRSAQQAAFLGERLPKLLEANLARRQRLYAHCGVSVQLASLNRSVLEPAIERLQLAAAKSWSLPDAEKLTIEDCRRIMAARSSSEESQLASELAVLRFFAREFNSLGDSVMAYFLGQFMAQERYRPSALKLAVQSETKFDGAFESLDGALRAVLAMPMSDSPPALARVYVPHYKQGSLRVLPYMPLSLDAACDRNRQEESAVWNSVISIDRAPDPACTMTLLKATPLAERNRLCADLSSFVAGAGQTSFEQQCWLWLDSLQENCTGDGLPEHLRYALLDDGDWTESAYEDAARLCQAAITLCQEVAA